MKLIRYAINILAHHYELTYRPSINRNANEINRDQNPTAPPQNSWTATKMTRVTFMTEVCTELAITKSFAMIDRFLCHDEGDVVLSTFGFTLQPIPNMQPISICFGGLKMVLLITVERLVIKVWLYKTLPCRWVSNCRPIWSPSCMCRARRKC